MIRRYEPGGFYGVIDKHAYDVALDHGVDEEVSFPAGAPRTAGSVADGAVWCGLLRLKEWWNDVGQTVGQRIADVAGGDDPLTKEEEEEIGSSVAIVFLERSNGWIDAVWYDDQAEADEAWTDVEEERAMR